MSDVAALRAEREKLMAEMIEMQKECVAFEQANGVSCKDYYYSQDGLLKDYRQVYMEKAMRVVDLAHQIVGSHV